MNIPLQQQVFTPEDLLTMPDGDRFELVDGKLVEQDMGALSSHVAGELFLCLGLFLRSHRLGWVFPADTTYQCFPGRPNVVRKPDVSFIRLGRLPNEELPGGHIRIASDLAAEVVSPKDLFYEVEEKVAEYRSAGVSLIWVIVPPTRTVLIRRGDGTASEVGPDGELDGEGVLPGFRCRVADLFRTPVTPAAPSTPTAGE
jgi:Uma2 family endonuclease